MSERDERRTERRQPFTEWLDRGVGKRKHHRRAADRAKAERLRADPSPEPGEIDAYTYDCQDWSDRDKVPSTIEITVGHYHTGMVPVYVRIRPRAIPGREP